LDVCIHRHELDNFLFWVKMINVSKSSHIIIVMKASFMMHTISLALVKNTLVHSARLFYLCTLDRQ